MTGPVTFEQNMMPEVEAVAVTLVRLGHRRRLQFRHPILFKSHWPLRWRLPFKAHRFHLQHPFLFKGYRPHRRNWLLKGHKLFVLIANLQLQPQDRLTCAEDKLYNIVPSLLPVRKKIYVKYIIDNVIILYTVYFIIIIYLDKDLKPYNILL